jgi:hypothetical protein
MNEPARRGRPPTKHLEQEHHYRTSDEPAAVVATPAAAESDQGSASPIFPLEPDSALPAPDHAEVIEVQENPTAELSLPPSVPQNITTNATVDTAEPLEAPQTSPAEQKIEALVEAANLNGWHNIETEVVLELPPKNGTAVYVSDKPSGQGTLVVWKKTRAFANATRRWEATGVWIDFVSGIPIAFKPKYWKERYVS